MSREPVREDLLERYVALLERIKRISEMLDEATSQDLHGL